MSAVFMNSEKSKTSDAREVRSWNLRLWNYLGVLKKKENVSQVEITEMVSVYFNNFNHQYKHDERVLSTFVPSKSLS